ncbi:HoxN/HupN/NixA family nickel/cobalt transporter [Helicobacter cetorum]|uniref:Nickel/cobalt efflux system n=1 Tax=Helicobacter cetorum (strain ATCC BAA-540 / CCUG 52418 / MIT 99-5656) TaxID=1163745 RepID=I0ETL2_HELCM|nr:HoxN/HupN/NixA family nickel/cobalt transporter [Helicobacter cetorum]AFI06281.1 high-affinity nickel-transport protein [Helicobacter cetorum MIT 99-5656]
MKLWLPYFLAIVFLHLLGFILLFMANNATFYAAASMAYMLGAKHAFDADHIACIDNTIRKLTQQGKNAYGVGFYFSMGHSSVVILMTTISAFAIAWAKEHTPMLEEVGGVVGTLVSGIFLLLMGLLNAIILMDLLKIFKQSHSNESLNEQQNEEIERLLASRGLLNRFFKPLFNFISKSWHIYPIGFLFGLGFDTASEIALLALSSSAIKVSVVGMLALPILFAAGMSLFDTLDGAFMLKAYDWAFKTPLRKIYYNISITALSVFIALGIGLVELFQVSTQKLHITFENPLLHFLQNLEFGDLGYYLVGLFVIAFLGSYLLWKFKISQLER